MIILSFLSLCWLMLHNKKYNNANQLFLGLAVLSALLFSLPNLFGEPYTVVQPVKTNTGKKISDYEALIKYYRYYKPDSAIYYAKKALALAESNKDSSGIALILNQSGMIDDNLGKFDESRQKYLRAASIYKTIGLKKGEATETIRLGVVELRKGNYDKATAYFLQALNLSELIGYKPGIMEAYLTLAEVYIARKQYDIALVYLKTAEKIDSSLPFSNLSLNIFSNFGVIYREKGDYKKAISYLEKGINLSNEPQYQGLNISLTNNLASVYARAGNKNRSVSLQKEALAKARKIQNYLREYQVLTSLAETYAAKDPSTAISYLQLALTLVREKGARKQEIEVLQHLGDIYKKLNNYKKALSIREQGYALTDSFFYKGMSKQISNLQTEYELGKSKAREQELKYLNNRQSLEGKIITSIMIGVIILLFIMIVYYFRTRELNRLLNKANAGLKESNEIKDKLFSVLGHDLRSPIASVINLLYMLNDEDLAEAEKEELINKLAVNCNASLETLNQLLKWGEMQIKGLRLNQTTFYPYEIIQRNIVLLSANAEGKSISVKNLAEESTTVFADQDHFDFILRNLLSNAIKFTPAGGAVTISSAVNETDNAVTFVVKDTGIGIDKDQIGSIFALNHISTNGTNNEKGTSLGLVMCKEFIEANRGAIEVKSEPNNGSEFIVTLQHSPRDNPF